MAKQPEGLARISDRLILGLCVSVSIWLLSHPAGERLALASSWAHALTTPVESVFGSIDGFATLRSENKELRTRIAALELDLAHILAEREVFESLRDRAGFHERSRGSLTPAKVLELVVGRFPLQAKIRSLGGDSLRVYQSVVTEKGLVGRIHQVLDADLALVELLTDPDSRISVLDINSGVIGLLHYDGSKFLMDHVPRGEPITVGDTIHTSGLGGTVPEGIPIGKVSSLSSSPAELFQVVEVEPFVRFSALDEVYVVMRPGPWYARRGDENLAPTNADDGDTP
jgi:rod shape-determining protein MreC